jgi:NADP-dependent 3-hydroxy acid dehydrogenase YdfG
MPTVTIIYGSEASVLRDFQSKTDDYLIKIYNLTKPAETLNSSSCTIEDFEKTLGAVTSDQSITKLRFIGAGFLNQSSYFIAENTHSIDMQIDTNISNYLKITSIMLPFMVKHKYGRIVYLSSIRAEIGGVGASIYSASKAFGERFFSTIGQEYGRLGVSATAIRMGFFESNMIDDYDSEKRKFVIKSVSNKKLGQQKDLTEAINFCFNNVYLNGGKIDLNGGLTYG